MPLIPVTQSHSDALAANLKPDHERELAWFDMKRTEGVAESVRSCGGHMLAGVHESRLLFIAGVSRGESLFGGAAVIVYLATTHYDNHLRSALRMTRRLFAHEVWRHTRHKRIEQYIPPPYTRGIRFLEWLGWTRGSVFSVGARQAIHMYFERESNGRKS